MRFIVCTIALFFVALFTVAGAKNKTEDTVALDSLKTFLGIDVLSVSVEKSSGFPSAEFSFGIEYRDGTIYYSSQIGESYTRPQIESNEYYKFKNAKSQFDLYRSPKEGGAGEPFPPTVNLADNEGALSISPSGEEVLFTRAEIVGKKMRYYISYAKETDSGWVENRVNGFSSNVANYAYPCWDKSGNRAYFCSDRQGGAGGMDIYYADKRSFGWSAPKALPKGINSAGNEIYPQIIFDTVLVFSTDGRSEFGGLDLVYAGIGSSYPTIQNLKQPLNSTDDDVQMIFEQDSIPQDSVLTGFIVSNRKAEKDELYTFRMQLGTRKEIVEPDSVLTVEADFLLDDRLADYASEILSELQEGLRDIYGSNLATDIGPVSDGSDGLEQGKRLVRLAATVEESYEQEVQFLMANAIENLLKKQDMLEALENEELATLADNSVTSVIQINASGSLGRDISKLFEAYSDQLIRDFGIPATVKTQKQANGDYSIVLESTANDRDKEAVADAIRNILGEIEANHSYAVKYGNGASSASQLASGYIFSGKMAVTIGRANEEIADVQVVMMDVDDSVDVYIEVLDAEDAHAGRRLQPTQRIKLKLPSMNFAVDAVIADAGNVADYKTDAAGHGSMTLYGKSYDSNNSGAYTSSTMYTIQVASLREPADADFFKGLIVNEYQCSDGYYRYTTGIARSNPGSQKLLSQVKKAGFEGAFVIEVNMIEKRLEKVYSIVIASGNDRIPAYKFPAGWKVAEYKGKTDNIYRYTIGEFDKIETALAELNRVKKLGYRGAFVDNIRRFNYVQLLHGAGK